jgi:NAD-dependent deacetylase
MNTLQDFDPFLCAELIKGSKALVAVTGAGISTAEGIPDVRGCDGLYAIRVYDPEKVFDILAAFYSKMFHLRPPVVSPVKPDFLEYFIN